MYWSVSNQDKSYNIFCFLFSDNSLKDTATKDKSPLKAGALGSKKMVRCHVTPFNLLNPIIYLAPKPKPTIVHCPNTLNIWYKGFLYSYICFGHVFQSRFVYIITFNLLLLNLRKMQTYTVICLFFFWQLT